MIISYPSFFIVPVIMEDNFDVNLNTSRSENFYDDEKMCEGLFINDKIEDGITEIYL